MSALATAVIGAGALIGAVLLLWGRLRSLARLSVQVEQLAPLLRTIAPIAVKLSPIIEDMAKHLGDTPQPFSVINEIVKEFRTDGGSSLRDVVNRIERAAAVAQAAADEATERVAAERGRLAEDRRAAEADRATLQRLMDELVAVHAELDRQQQGDHQR